MAPTSKTLPSMASTETKAERRKAKRQRRRLRKLEEARQSQSDQSPSSDLQGQTTKSGPDESVKLSQQLVRKEPKPSELAPSEPVKIPKPKSSRHDNSQPVKIKELEPSKIKQAPSSRLQSPQPQPPKPKFLSESEWHPSKLAPDLRFLGFSKGYEPFNIKDSHLDLIVAAGPNFCHKIEEFRCGDDATGYGSSLSDATVISLAKACPNLTKVSLTSACSLTDESLVAFLTHCPKIHSLGISGNDKRKGHIDGKATLAALRKSKAFAKELKTLGLADQILDSKTARAISNNRKALEIQTGDSSDKWYDFGSIDTWKGGMRNGIDESKSKKPKNAHEYWKSEYEYWCT